MKISGFITSKCGRGVTHKIVSAETVGDGVTRVDTCCGLRYIRTPETNASIGFEIQALDSKPCARRRPR